ncbi:hypothetical protein GcC1_c19826o5 [Golovinomyces cichoracearum]|uniref:Secreted protein n=1 Tax=Golovinomyces cichoracearum TaxID=62708 RepID=A0A420IMS4_9PEZI|nr:hypothetical protein GcC1_c19826o5 [Golovinomyces cichoracearum]
MFSLFNTWSLISFPLSPLLVENQKYTDCCSMCARGKSSPRTLTCASEDIKSYEQVVQHKSQKMSLRRFEFNRLESHLIDPGV